MVLKIFLQRNINNNININIIILILIIFLYILHPFFFDIIVSKIIINERKKQRLAKINANKITRRRLRDILDPFALSENQFIGFYRLIRNMTRGLIKALEPHLPSQRSPLAILNELKVKKKYIIYHVI